MIEIFDAIVPRSFLAANSSALMFGMKKADPDFPRSATIRVDAGDAWWNISTC